MAEVRVREREPFESAVRRFKRLSEKVGVLTQIRRKQFFVKPSAMRKRKLALAIKRHFKKMLRENVTNRKRDRITYPAE